MCLKFDVCSLCCILYIALCAYLINADDGTMDDDCDDDKSSDACLYV